MSRSHGTGMPLSFQCTMCRRSPCLQLRRDGTRLVTEWRCEHTQRRTGRVRALTSSQKGKGGARVLQERHEYVCDCGHHGWSRVQGVETLPLVQTTEEGR